MAQRIDTARHRTPQPCSPLRQACRWLGALLPPLFTSKPAPASRLRPTPQTSPLRTAAPPRPPTRAPRDRALNPHAQNVPPLRRLPEQPVQDPADHRLAALIRQIGRASCRERV